MFAIIPIVVLAIGVIGMPIGYYMFLRFIVCLFAGGFAFYLKDKNRGVWPIFAVAAVLYNPIFPIFLSRDAWIPINLATMALFAFAYFEAKNLNQAQIQKDEEKQRAEVNISREAFNQRKQITSNADAAAATDDDQFDFEREQYFQKALKEFQIEIDAGTGKLIPRVVEKRNARFMFEMARIYSYKFDQRSDATGTDWTKYYSLELQEWAGSHFDEIVAAELEKAEQLKQEMWSYLIDKYGETHPTGTHHEAAQNHRLEVVEKSSLIYVRAMIEQCKRLGHKSSEVSLHIPPAYRDVTLWSYVDLPPAPWS